MPATVAVLDDAAVSDLPRDHPLPLERAGDQAAPQKLFYGWLMLPLAMLVMIATSPGQTFGISFFNSQFRTAFELSQTRLSVTYLVATVIASFALPIIGGWTDRFGLKRSILVAVVAMVGACAFASQVQGVTTLLIAFVLLRTTGPGTMTLLANNTLAAWFNRRLGFASGIMQVGMAGALAVVPAGIVLLIDTFGWRGAFLALAAMVACALLPPILLFYRESPSELGQFSDGDPRCFENKPDSVVHAAGSSVHVAVWGMDLKQAMQHRAYWILLAAAAVWALIGTGLVFHLDAIFQSNGMGVRESTRAMTCLAIAMGAMQVIGGLMADRLPMRWLVSTAIGLIAVSCTMLSVGQGTTFIAAYAVYGVAQGLNTIIAATAWTRYFGRAHLGRIRGVSLTAAIAGSSVGPLMMGVSADYLGGFTPSLWLFTAMAAVIAIAGIWATPPEEEVPRL